MAINQELLSQIEASADDWGPAGKYGNEEDSVRAGKEDAKTLYTADELDASKAEAARIHAGLRAE